MLVNSFTYPPPSHLSNRLVASFQRQISGHFESLWKHSTKNNEFYLSGRLRTQWPNKARLRRPARECWRRRRWGKRWPCRCVRQSRWPGRLARSVSLVCSRAAGPRRWDLVRFASWRWNGLWRCRPRWNTGAWDSRRDRWPWRSRRASLAWRLRRRRRRKFWAKTRGRCRSDLEFAERRGPSPFSRRRPLPKPFKRQKGYNFILLARWEREKEREDINIVCWWARLENHYIKKGNGSLIQIGYS